MLELCDMMMIEFTKMMDRQSSEQVYPPLRFSRRSRCDGVQKAMQVEFPSFDGDPVGWNTRVETYFKVQGTSDEVQGRLEVFGSSVQNIKME
jgi:hypothetical protein